MHYLAVAMTIVISSRDSEILPVFNWHLWQINDTGPGCLRSLHGHGEGQCHGGHCPEETGLPVHVHLRQPQTRLGSAGHQHAPQGLRRSQPHGARPGLEEHVQLQVSQTRRLHAWMKKLPFLNVASGYKFIQRAAF